MTTRTDPAVREWAIWSTTARIVVTDPGQLVSAVRIAEQLLVEVELAASRFRPDSEISRLPDALAGGDPVPVGPRFADLIAVALGAAERTDGLVDPTLGRELISLGYDRDVSELDSPGLVPGLGGFASVSASRPASWRGLRLTETPDGHLLSAPSGVELDLGATAKARAADLIAARILAELGTGNLVSLGGDIATAGPGPVDEVDGHWQIEVRDGADQPGCSIGLPPGAAIATSSTRHRIWSQDGNYRHHLLDPATGLPVTPHWRTITVAAGDCVTANTLSTGAMVAGANAQRWLADRGAAARLVSAEGMVRQVGGWPS
jgi:thiamine biosynthesis lipoprotein